LILSMISNSYPSILQDLTYFSFKKHNAYLRTKSVSHKTLASPGCEGSVLVIRHCEKDHSERHCNYLGFERAQYLNTLFGTRWPAPSYLFAYDLKRKHKKVYREIETLTPLSTTYGLNITSIHSSADMAKSVHKLMSSGDICGKLVVICWKHSEIPKLVQHLGCGPYEGCPLDYPSDTFDQAWQVKVVYGSGKGKHSINKWWIFGGIVQENFDALEFSYEKGDYPVGGKANGGSWYDKNMYGMQALDGME